jgi:glyoxalase family protein
MPIAQRPAVTGLHHVTCIAGDAQANVEFYVGVMGMRLVKRSVNQDAPGTYHLFYADALGHAGTDLTFFPWPEMGPGRRGIGLTVEIALAIPPGGIPFWQGRLAGSGAAYEPPVERFGERVLPVTASDGVRLALTETADAREFTPWPGGPVPEEMQVRGLHGVRLWERELEPTTRFLVDALGFDGRAAREEGWHRYRVGEGGSGRFLELCELPGERRGAWGVGSVHHVAWRVPDDAAQARLHEAVTAAGQHPTPVIDRFWFRSVYFKEPGGALFEIATDGPGFGVDEAPESLGTHLVLPPWLEPRRAVIEGALPDLINPYPSP